MDVPEKLRGLVADRLPPEVAEYEVVADTWEGFVERVREEFLEEIGECDCRCEAVEALVGYTDWDAVARNILLRGGPMGVPVYLAVRMNSGIRYVRVRRLEYTLG